MRKSRQNGFNGFSLAELLAVVALLGIFAGFALPAVTESVQRQRVRAAALRLWSDLLRTRGEALKTGLPVSLCAAAAPGSAAPAYRCSRSPRWHQGWLMFIDANKNARRDEAEKILYYQPALRGIHISATRARPAVTYTRLGAAYFSNTTLRVRAAGRSAGRFSLTLVVAASGNTRIRVSQPPQ